MRLGRAVGFVAGWKATDGAQRARQSFPQHLQCVWMSHNLLLGQCSQPSHPPGLHCDGRSAGDVSQAAGCWHLRNWSPLSIQTARPYRQHRSLLPAAGSAQTWGGQQRVNMNDWLHKTTDREWVSVKRKHVLKDVSEFQSICVFLLTYMSPKGRRILQWGELNPDMLILQTLWMGLKNDWWSVGKKNIITHP